MTREDPRNLFPLTGRAMRDIAGLPDHPEDCDVRQTLFGNSKRSQRETLTMLGSITGADVAPLLARFSAWEADASVAPSETAAKAFRYLNAHTKIPDEIDSGGGVATMGERPDTQTMGLVDLFFKAIEHRVSHALPTSASGLILPGNVSLPDTFLNDFVAEMVSDPSQEERFRTMLALYFFVDIHTNLIYPPHAIARGIDRQVHHSPQPFDPNREQVLRQGGTEMDSILREVPFALNEEFHPQAEVLQGISTRFLPYFAPLGWKDQLREEVTMPHMRRMQQTKAAISPENN
jgi:hypothetical protein